VSFTLGIDTSGTTGSVALRGPEVDLEESFSEGMIHGVALAPAVAALLERAGIAAGDLGLVAVGVGPGSYTGVRVGVAFAKTLAFTTGTPLVGISSFDAIARNAPAGCGPVVCARDARRETLYVATYDSRADGVVPVRPLALRPRGGIAAELPAGALVLGDALSRFADSLSGGGRQLGEPSLWHARAAVVARLGAESNERLDAASAHELAPVYLRRSEAEERWAERYGEEA
jgi:tRNA threonylcarbamoyladenosine biosynthesis protein TsaB